MKNVVYDIAFKLPICCLITHDINNPMSITIFNFTLIISTCTSAKDYGQIKHFHKQWNGHLCFLRALSIYDS